MDAPNQELHLAEQYIRDTGCHIFLTGKAGTGKTTFLHSLKKNSTKRLVVAAPTGVAAINAGGVTLHSFFQLPFGPIVPGRTLTSAQYRFSKDKINIIKSLDLLIIDEISMVRADLLDGIDQVLRRYRHSNLPFAGVQLLMIGDLFQLPPVVKTEEWRILSEYYPSPYFFNCRALQQSEMTTVELKKIYRQADSVFIDILNQVRNSNLTPDSLEKVAARSIRNFSSEESDGYITLCTHNSHADRINNSKLEMIQEKPHAFTATVEGEFPDHTFPTAADLSLKEGAQVMFVRNDHSYEKRYFNGKIGTIAAISHDKICIDCPGDEEEIEVEPVTWENIEYSFNQDSNEISEKKIGAFTQYPLRLAWAITIHKSQGLTFDKAIIDAEAAFAHGQVYVALSRCRSLEGLVLNSPLPANTMKPDPAVLQFTATAQQNAPDESGLRKAQILYQQRLLLECFDFQRLRSQLKRLTSLVLGNKDLVQILGIDSLADLQKSCEDAVCRVGENFQRQLSSLFCDDSLPAEDPAIIMRLTKASAYFEEKITTLLGSCMSESEIESDNKDLRKKGRQRLTSLQEEIRVKLAAVKCCSTEFSPTAYFSAVSLAAINKEQAAPQKKESVSFSEADIVHPDLFQLLKKWRSDKAQQLGVPHYQVLHQKTLIQIVIHLPDSPAALLQIRGIGKKLLGKYGDEIIDIIRTFRKDHGIHEVVLPEVSGDQVIAEKQKIAKKPQGNTREITLEMFEKGLNAKEIAQKRGLVLTTIEGHLAYFVEKGIIPVEKLVSDNTRKTIEEQLAVMPEKSLLRDIKNMIGPEISYGEIKIVLAHQSFSKESSK